MEKNKTALLISALGILLCSVVTLTSVPKEDVTEMLPEMLPAALIGWIPYILTFLVSSQTKASRFRESLNGGLLLYLIIDLVVRYDALHRATSSTAGIAVFLVLIASVIIIPVGAGLTYLLLALRK